MRRTGEDPTISNILEKEGLQSGGMVLPSKMFMKFAVMLYIFRVHGSAQR